MEPSPVPIIVNVSEGSSVWVTAGAALLGALVGAVGSYMASVRVQERVARGRAAVRRKARIYTPLRLELSKFLEELEAPWYELQPIVIDSSDPNLGVHGRNKFVLWDLMKDDGRATSASSLVHSAMENLLTSVQFFNGRVRSSQDRTKDLLKENWSTSSGGGERPFFDSQVSELLLEKEIRPDKSSPDAELVTRVFETVQADPRLTDERALVNKALTAMKQRIRETIATLDASMKRIAERYERELPED